MDALVEVVKVVSTVIGVLVPLFFGWRFQMVSKRRFEIAEQALVDFSKAHFVIRGARSPGGFGGEGSSRIREANEPEEIARQKDVAYIPVERLMKNVEVFAPLEKDRLLVLYHFGSEAAKPFDELKSIYDQIFVASGMMMRSVALGTINHQMTFMKYDAQLWSSGENDKTQQRMDTALADLERHLQPVLDPHSQYRLALNWLKRLRG